MPERPMKAPPAHPHTLSPEEAVAHLQTDPQKGLSKEDVRERRRQFGENRLERQRRKPIPLIFLEQFLDPVIYVLLAAAALGFAFGEFIEAVAVLVVILITATIGFVMEWQARRSMEALRKMSEVMTTVLRDGKSQSVRADELVPGDLLALEAGDVAPADARLLSHERLAMKEASLTGESDQVEKSLEALPEDTPLAERRNMIFAGSLVTRGTARALVTATGERTEMGKIGRLTREAEKESTPIEKKLAHLSKRLIWLTLALAAIIGTAGYLQGRDLTQMIETAIALAVAAIPEGLPIVATIALARGMLRLARKSVVIKKLASVQTLGEAGIICTDKTGTLTENQMKAQAFVLADDQFETPEEAPSTFFEQKKKDRPFRLLVETGLLCNNVALEPADDGARRGDPVEIALMDLAASAGFDARAIREAYPEQVELPFDTETKMMATLNRSGQRYRIHAKGALEALLDRCDSVLDPDGVQPLTDRKRWLEAADTLAARGLRTLAFAFREVDEAPGQEQLLDRLVLIGLAGFLDPPRQDVRDAIATCRRAGIRVVMVTGDHPETARQIAIATGLLENDAVDGTVMTGRQLDAIGEDGAQREKRLLDAVVFARVTPAQKLTLVDFYQKHRKVVGMTGDGVNDTPALKKADIGIAMGIRGTEAAKEVADVILRDDRFTSIELAIRQGRVIFENIRKFVVYLLSSNLAEIVSVGVASLSSLPLPLLPLQILYLNLVTDVFPALALGLGEGEEHIMDRPPRPNDEPIMPRRSWMVTLTYGLCITAAVLGITVFSEFVLDLPTAKVNNMAFYTLVLGQLLNVFNLPPRQESFFNNEVTRNRWVWGALLLCVLLTGLGYAVPVLREALSLVPISGMQLGWVGLFAAGSLLLSQLIKRLFRLGDEPATRN